MPVKFTYKPVAKITNTFFNGAKVLLQDVSYCDVVLVCEGGKRIVAHKVILAAMSPYFDALFSATDFVSSSDSWEDRDDYAAKRARTGNQVVVCSLTDVKYRYVKAVVDWIYRNHLVLDNQGEDFDNFIKTARDVFGVEIDRTTFSISLDQNFEEATQPGKNDRAPKANKRTEPGSNVAKGGKKAKSDGAVGSNAVALLPSPRPATNTGSNQSMEALRTVVGHDYGRGQEQMNEILSSLVRQQQQVNLYQQIGQQLSGCSAGTMVPNWNPWQALSNLAAPKPAIRNGDESMDEGEAETGAQENHDAADGQQPAAPLTKMPTVARIKCTWDNCKKYFRSENSMLAHRLSIHYNMTLLCPRRSCGKEFERSTAFISHVTCHAEYIEADTINRILKDSEKYSIYLAKQHPPPAVQQTSSAAVSEPKKNAAAKKKGSKATSPVDLTIRPTPTSTTPLQGNKDLTFSSSAFLQMGRSPASGSGHAVPPGGPAPLGMSPLTTKAGDNRKVSSSYEQVRGDSHTSGGSSDETTSNEERPKSRSDKVTSSQQKVL